MSRVIYLRPETAPAQAGPMALNVPDPTASTAAATPTNRLNAASAHPILDHYRRPLRDLRISVTDRCNFRCTYCMPREIFGANYHFMPSSSLLRFEEIQRVAQAAVALGVRKLRLTGGEPLLRKGLDKLVAMLAELHTPDGTPIELALTTNATLLAQQARALKRAGLHRVSVSLDALDEDVFARLSDSTVHVRDVLNGIEAAAQAGLHPIKINMVVRKGANEDQILPMTRHFRHSGHILRFIEYMDVGNSNHWHMQDVLTGRQILDIIGQEFELQALAPAYRGEVATRWHHIDGGGEIGLITSVSQPFCGDCTRARLSPEGRLYLCLFAHEGHDLRTLLRQGISDDVLQTHLTRIWHPRTDRYSELRGHQGLQATNETASGTPPKIEMSYIGG